VTADREAARPRPARLYDFVGWGTFVLVLVGCVACVWASGRRHLDFYKEFLQGDLPAPAQIALALVEVLWNHWYWLVPLLALLGGLPLLLSRGRAWIFHAVMAAMLILLALMTRSAMGLGIRQARLQFTGTSAGPCDPDAGGLVSAGTPPLAT
jgi:ABC-type Mn2+/Zn2+ transport system permease subunit